MQETNHAACQMDIFLNGIHAACDSTNAVPDRCSTDPLMGLASGSGVQLELVMQLSELSMHS